MKERISKKVVTIIIAISVIPCIFLLTVMAVLIYGYLFNHPTSDSDINKIALDYAKYQCKILEKDSTLCKDLRVSLGAQQEDFAKVFWIVYVQKNGTDEIYASFVVDGNGGSPKVKEGTYTLNQPQ